MVYKQICPIHHFRYSGSRCPVCESERIKNMERRLMKKKENESEPTEETVDEELDWSALSDKFNIKSK